MLALKSSLVFMIGGYGGLEARCEDYNSRGTMGWPGLTSMEVSEEKRKGKQTP